MLNCLRFANDQLSKCAASSGIPSFSIHKKSGNSLHQVLDFLFQVNSLMAADDLGKPWLSVKNFLVETRLQAWQKH